ALWLLVLLKLLTPPLVWLSFPWPAAPVEQAVLPAEVGCLRCQAAPVPSAQQWDTTAEEGLVAAEVSAPAEPWWPTALLCAWLGGTACCWVTAWRRGRRLLRLLGSLPPASAPTAAAVARVAALMGLRRLPDVRAAGGPVPPLAFGLGRGCLV